VGANSCKPTPMEEHRPLHPIHLVGRSGGKPHDKLLGNGADSDDDFIPATSTAQATTISHDSPYNFIVQPYDTAASPDCRSVLEVQRKLLRGAGVLAS
jgi:hypothetical protein